MRKYPKIQSIFKREPKKPRRLIMGDYAVPELEDLAEAPWEFTEKIDGMNIRIEWDGDRSVEFGGRTDNAILPTQLLSFLYATFTPDSFRNAFGEEHEGPVLLFGEGYGKGIQKGGNYRTSQGFILFDVVIGQWWLKRASVDDIAENFGIPSVPVLFTGSLETGIEYVSSCPKSHVGGCVMEGLVGRPRCGLKDRRGNPIMVKIKVVDFK